MPGGQCLQTAPEVAFVSSENLPLGHKRHAEAPASDENEPPLQAVGVPPSVQLQK